jgi:hypothetical protein
MLEMSWLREKVDYSLCPTHGSIRCINLPFVVYRGLMVHAPPSIVPLTLRFSEDHSTTSPGMTNLPSTPMTGKRGITE